MKYYKLVKALIECKPCELGVIYPGSLIPIGWVSSIEHHAELYVEEWQEVPASEFYLQEGKMPEYFAIKRVEGNPLWEKYITWLNITYNRHLDGDSRSYPYYGFGGRNTRDTDLYESKLINFQNTPVRLSLEQWDKIVNKKEMKEEFVLPNTWFVQLTEENKEIVEKWHRKIDELRAMRIYSIGSFYGVDSKGKGDSWYSKELIPSNTQIITTEQFKKYVLKEDAMIKEIIGWKLKDEYIHYRNAALAICNTIVNWENSLMPFDISVKQTGYISDLQKAGVLELWFEPVYAIQIPNIEINGYKGEFFEDYVKFGCAKIDKDIFILFYESKGGQSNREIESVTIDKGAFTKKHIKEIAEYYLNK